MRISNKVAVLLLYLHTLAPQAAMAKDTLAELTEHMKYLAERDKVLSKNIAHSDTPRYLPQDLINTNREPSNSLRFTTTNPMHIDINENATFQLTDAEIQEIKPNGNAVTLEHEMFKKSENAAQLQEAANLYNKAKGMLKTAITGRK